jgi:hypothetical protein
MLVKCLNEQWVVQEVTNLSPYANCKLVRRKHNGEWKEWEWENPPMNENEEFRTTKRWGGLPVYVKKVNLGSIAPGGYQSLEHTDNAINPINVYGWGSGRALPYFAQEPTFDIKLYASGNAVKAYVGTAHTTNINVQAVVEYVK